MNWLYRLIFGNPKSGANPQPKDVRDFKFHDEFKVGSVSSKTIPSLYEWSLPNQKGTNACVGFSLARLVEILIYQIVKEETGNDYYDEISELFFWALAREMEDTAGENVGVYPRDAFKALFKYGYLSAEELPFDNNPLSSPDQYDMNVARFARDMLVAMKFKYYAVRKSDAIALVNKGQAVAVSMPVANSWYNSRYAKDEEPNNSGYHYMVLEGVKTHNEVEYLKFSNWWGRGYLYVPKSYYLKHARDLWTLASK